MWRVGCTWYYVSTLAKQKGRGITMRSFWIDAIPYSRDSIRVRRSKHYLWLVYLALDEHVGVREDAAQDSVQ